MEFKFSSVVDPSTYVTHGLCDGIPLRCHNNPELEEIGILKCHEDWRKSVGPLGLYRGCFGPRWNAIAITIPECLPERLKIVSYVVETGFLYDDIMDMGSLQGEHSDYYKAAFEGAGTGDIRQGIHHAKSGKRQMQMYIVREMLALSDDQATTAFEGWLKMADQISSRRQDKYFKTEAEYIEYRMKDVGALFWYGLLTFGMGITIPENEIEVAHQLANVAYLNLLLTNDLYSYQKEYEAAKSLGEEQLVNAVWVLMSEQCISEAEAKELCKEKIRQSVVDYRKIVQETNQRTDVSAETKRYIEALLYTMSGNLVWSIDCPKYHSSSTYNERQFHLAKNGVTISDNIPSVKDSHESTKTNGVSPHGLISSSASDPPHFPHVHALFDMVGTGLVFATRDLTAQGAKKIIDAPAFTEREHHPDVSLTNGNHTDRINETQTGDILQRHPVNLDIQVIQAPYNYLLSLPSKGVREKAIDALNVWFQVPPTKLKSIKFVADLLHNASLMLDDIQDGSQLRRGNPSTHTIFGVGQTVNAANYQFLLALEEMQKFADAESLAIFIEELKHLHIGQSLDIHWTSNLICPSVEEYFKMVECKTGGLFKLFGRLMAVHSTNTLKLDVNELCNTLGRYYQVRDDYQNLVSPQYTEQKGFCEDLDEGKFSLPLIHLMHTNPNNQVLRNIWMQRRVNNGSSMAHKQTILAMMHQSGSLAFTADYVRELHTNVEKRVEELEAETGIENPKMGLILKMLEI
ncbi:putative geranylgeranyl diphosphate synthase [Xylariaceae sp. AK1471]|nr:putative geranylgeranyl diphosphate synthase [Xylariaceae sp. AK1471]